MIKYKVVEEYSAYSLECAVNKFLNDGWLLIGGVAVYDDGDGSTSWAQAMTLREPLPKEYE